MGEAGSMFFPCFLHTHSPTIAASESWSPLAFPPVMSSTTSNVRLAIKVNLNINNKSCPSFPYQHCTTELTRAAEGGLYFPGFLKKVQSQFKNPGLIHVLLPGLINAL